LRLTAGRLAELTGLTTGAPIGVVDRLERAGFVRRERDASDRRRVIVHLVAERGGRSASSTSRSRGNAIALEHIARVERGSAVRDRG